MILDDTAKARATAPTASPAPRCATNAARSCCAPGRRDRLAHVLLRADRRPVVEAAGLLGMDLGHVEDAANRGAAALVEVEP